MRLIDAHVLSAQYKVEYDLADAMGNAHRKKGWQGALQLLYDAPTIDPESLRPKGRWETANDGTHFCPHCGCDAPYTWDDIDRSFINSADDVPDRPSNYCPNCGAKMMEG